MPAQTDLEQAKHVFQAVILTVLSNGTADAAEAVVIAKIRSDFPQIAALPDIGAIGKEVRTRYQGIGMEACARAVANGIYDRDYRELAFVLCVKVMQADGETDLEEAELLGLFQELFSFTGDEVKALIARAKT